MAAEKINYTPVEWDTTKSLGPTNFNHMDNGIKKACDGVDELQDEVDEINGKIIDIVGVHYADYVVLGKGWNNLAYTFIPFNNADKHEISIISANVYNGQTSVTIELSVGNKSKDGFVVSTGATYVGYCVRFSYKVS